MILKYLKGKVVLSICMHTRKGYSENWTVVMKSSAASVSKLTSRPVLMKSMSTVTLPVTTSAPLKPQASNVFNRQYSIHFIKENKTHMFQFHLCTNKPYTSTLITSEMLLLYILLMDFNII